MYSFELPDLKRFRPVFVLTEQIKEFETMPEKIIRLIKKPSAKSEVPYGKSAMKSISI